MQMNRRLDKLEAVLPENVTSYRVLFKHEGEPDPFINPPLKPNEQVVMTTFVSAERRRAGMINRPELPRCTN